jgi:hypothetical protein
VLLLNKKSVQLLRIGYNRSKAEKNLLPLIGLSNVANPREIRLIDMTDQKLLGVLLQDAHLISDFQIQIALIDQQAYGMYLGDVLVLHGWLQQETLDFFLHQWNYLQRSHEEFSLEDCLQSAGLLSEQQLHFIRQEQVRTHQNLRQIVLQQRWLKKQTLDFFEATIMQTKLVA